MRTPDVLVSARGIRMSFGTTEVLHGVSLEVRAGEVLALLGENGAGKSTLVRILAGDHVPSAGEVLINGDNVTQILSPRVTRRLGLHLIPQELSGVESLTVAENVALGSWPTTRHLVSWRRMRRQAREMLSALGLSINVDQLVGDLGVGERQLIDIARALVSDAKILVLDEPTAALSQSETAELFRLVRTLRDRGAGIIYITHRLQEVRELADRVQVLRDGLTVIDGRLDEFDHEAIVAAMVGSSVHVVRRDDTDTADTHAAAPVLSLIDASSTPAFRHVDLALQPGKVVTLYGKIGSGAAEVADSLFGLRHLDEGELIIRGNTVTLRDPADAIAHGIGYLPGDRRSSGFRTLSLASNLAAPSWKAISRHGLLGGRTEESVFQRWRTTLSVRGAANGKQELWTLSGGNQQKVLLGRWLQTGAQILVMAEPTRGVDIKARQEIYRLLRLVADEGGAVLVATSDQEEAAQIADQAFVMSGGRIVAHLQRGDISEERLLEAAIRGEGSIGADV